MDFHLSWSITQLIVTFFFNLLVVIGFAYFLIKNKSTRKFLKVALLAAFTIVSTLYVAIDVGTRQQDLPRSSFNAIPSKDPIDKVERQRATVESTKQSFEKAVKQTPTEN